MKQQILLIPNFLGIFAMIEQFRILGLLLHRDLLCLNWTYYIFDAHVFFYWKILFESLDELDYYLMIGYWMQQFWTALEEVIRFYA